MNLEERMIKALKDHNKDSMGLWEMANIIYDGCMEKRLPGNGGRITALKNAAIRSGRLTYFLLTSCNDAPYVALEDKEGASNVQNY